MEENLNQNTQQNNMGIEAEAQGKTGKLFTQDEVNSFIQSRVSRMKSQADKEASAAVSQKEAELNAREIKLTVKEQLLDRGMPKELADIITGENAEDIKHKLDAIEKIYGKRENAAEHKEEKLSGFVQVGIASDGGGFVSGTDPVRQAMGLKG